MFGGLSIAGDGAPPAGQVRPRRLALLAILAVSGERGISRELLLAILWGESTPDRAKHSLSQALYSLRKDLGIEVVVTVPTIRLDDTRIGSDVGEFRAAVATASWERAALTSAAPFLDGFYLAEAPLFERWADEQREQLAREAVVALRNAARSAASEGRLADAASHWRAIALLDPLDGDRAISYMKALAASGDRAGALRHGQAHVALLARELEVEPNGELTALLGELRARIDIHVDTRTPADISAGARRSAPFRLTPGVTTALPSRRRIRAPRRGRLLLLGSAVIMLAAASSAPAWRRALERTGPGDATPTSARSPLADRLYQEGLRAFYGSDGADASRLFNAAASEDSSFAMAAYFAWRAELATDGARQDSLAERALRLAPNAADRDRLLILAHVRAWRWDMGAIPLADSLATRYPRDVDGLMVASDVAAGLAPSVTLLERAIALDSAVSVAPSAPCRACDALRRLAHRYEWADSTRAVLATLDRWSALRPDDYLPWAVRADYLVGLGRRKESLEAERRADSLGAPHRDTLAAPLVRLLRSDDVQAAGTSCGARLDDAAGADYETVRWLCTIALRMQGRHRDALNLARVGRNPWTGRVRRGVPVDRVHGAILDMEMGRPLIASRQFAQLADAAASDTRFPGRVASAVTIQLALSATAAALGGDTLRMRELVDSVELTGHRSLLARDPLLHHFLRGVLLSEAGAHESAVRAFRAALSSPSHGYTRINYELGRSLIALGRPAEAIPVLRAPLHGALDGSGLYLTRTETHEMLARAFDAAGQRDSAASHYTVVERAWRDADPALDTRYGAARRWLASGGRR